MATRQWIGGATNEGKSDIWTLTVGGTVVDGSVFTVAFGGQAVFVYTYVDATPTAAEAGPLIAAAWNLATNTHPYMTGITASAAGAVVTLTADVVGLPFLPTSSASGAATFIAVNTILATGPNFANNALNWSGGVVPASGDTVVFRDSAISVSWGLDRSLVLLARLEIHQSYTGKVGLDSAKFAQSADGATVTATAVEYRETYLKYGVATAGAATIEIGLNDSQGIPAGSGRLMLDLGTAGATSANRASKIVVHNTAAASSESGRPAVRLKVNSTDAAMLLEVKSAPGGVGIGVDKAGETGLACTTIQVPDPTALSRVFTSSGVAVTTWEQNGGNNLVRSSGNITTFTGRGGTAAVEGAIAITTLTNTGATVYPNNVPASGNAVGTLNARGGTTDFTRESRVRAVGATNRQGGVIRFTPDEVDLGTITGVPCTMS